MIYWLTGQPSSGKTTLANKIREDFILNGHQKELVKIIDGDDLRLQTSNNDFSVKGRTYNVDMAQKIAYYLHMKNEIVIVSLVSPYLNQRENFKEFLGDNIKEFYIHTTEKRERSHYHVKDYQPPISNFIDIDTTIDSVDDSFKKIKKFL